VVFSDVWQGKDLKSFVFGCVAMIRLTDTNLGCVARIGLSRKKLSDNARERRAVFFLGLLGKLAETDLKSNDFGSAANKGVRRRFFGSAANKRLK